MIFDIHAHVFPEKVAAKAASSIGAFYNHSNMECDGTVRSLLKLQDKAGISGALIHSVAIRPENVSAINQFIGATVKEYPDRFAGFGALHPDCLDVPAVLEEISSLGLKGVKIHPDMQGFSLAEPRFLKMLDMVRASGLPILIHTGDNRFHNTNPSEMRVVLKNFPDLFCICAHLGGYTVWEEAADLLPAYENVYIDTSSSLFAMTSERAREIIRKYDRERVLFGTDYPMWEPEKELERFSKLQLTGEEEERILWKNAAALLGWEEKLK